MIWAQAKRTEWFAASHLSGLCEDQRRGGDEVGDVLVGRPDFPKIRGAGASALRIRLHQCDGLPDAWSASPLLVISTDQVGIHMKDICHAQPVVLDAAQLP